MENKVKWIGILVVSLIILLILWFSSKPGEVSIEQSDRFLLKLRVIEQYDIDAETERYLERRYIARKGAHLLIYMVLGGGVALFWRRDLRRTLVAVGALAGLDEFQQMFNGRGASIRDVVIDIIGGALGWFAVSLCRRLGGRLKKKGFKWGLKKR